MKSLIAFLILISYYIDSRSQVDTVWQAYYDSTDLFWGSNWTKTADLLEKGKLYLETTISEYKLDSTYNLTINDLGLCYKELGRYEHALKMQLQALENTGNSSG